MKPIGKIRRSQVLTGNGPGAIIDFRGENGAPLSVVAAGLEAWDRLSGKPGLLNDQRIYHEPLQARFASQGIQAAAGWRRAVQQCQEASVAASRSLPGLACLSQLQPPAAQSVLGLRTGAPGALLRRL